MMHLPIMLTSVTFLTLAGPALALDGTDMMRKLSAATSADGTTMSFENAEVDGDTVTATGVKVGYLNLVLDTLEVGNIVFKGVKETDAGGYYVESVSLPDVEMKQEGGDFSVKDIRVAGLRIPSKAEGLTLDDFLLYDSASIGAIAFNIADKNVLSIESTVSNLTRVNTGFNYDAKVAGIKADLSHIEEAALKDAIEKLGLTTIDGVVTMSGSWNTESGRVKIDEYNFDFTNIGQLNLAVDFSGYTLDLIRSLQNAVKAADANSNKDEANQAASLAMMALMQQMTFNSASIRFDDASITRKALDYAGAQQGVTGEQFAQSLKTLLPVMLGQLNVPELEKQISTAVDIYLAEPQNFAISASPEKPVAFRTIAAAATEAPNTLSTILGVKVIANE
ncbi:hypothetical protein [Rhizobium hainanense]|nr:hypothetical protein [Rhizobium hainanense]